MSALGTTYLNQDIIPCSRRTNRSIDSHTRRDCDNNSDRVIRKVESGESLPIILSVIPLTAIKYKDRIPNK